MIDPVVQELQQEAAITRKVLERVPEELGAWKPHEKSMTMMGLASHMAETFSWTGAIVGMDTFEMRMDEYTPFTAESKAHLLETFDKNLADCLDQLRGLPDDKLMVTWKMVMEGKTVMEMPRIVVIKAMQINHMIHHRAQLGLYLRLNDVPVPAIYGPSADEEG